MRRAVSTSFAFRARSAAARRPATRAAPTGRIRAYAREREGAKRAERLVETLGVALAQDRRGLPFAGARQEERRRRRGRRVGGERLRRGERQDAQNGPAASAGRMRSHVFSTGRCADTFTP